MCIPSYAKKSSIELMHQISFVVAFAGGLVSFLSPCVLPILPGFLSYLAGVSTNETGSRRKDTFLASFFFVLGFVVVFSLLGVLLNTILTHLASGVQVWLARAGGGLVIIFGLYLVGLVRIHALEREYHFSVKIKFKSRHLTSFIFGAAFAAGWTPCVGAVLGGILGLTLSAPGSAFILLFAYSLGLGLPFLGIGLAASQASRLIQKYTYILRPVRMFFGAVLVGIGILAFTQNLGFLANFELLNRFLLR